MSVENATSAETGKLCEQYLGPALRLLNFNNLPFPFNAYLGKSPSPDKLIYSDPNLAPGGSGASLGPAEIPPAVSAYTGYNGDVPPPAGWNNPTPDFHGAYAPNGLPADPSAGVVPGRADPTRSAGGSGWPAAVVAAGHAAAGRIGAAGPATR